MLFTNIYLSLHQFFDKQKRCLRNRNGKPIMERAFLEIRELRVEFPDGTVLSLGKLEHVTEGWVVKAPVGQNLQGEKGMMEAISIATQTTGTIAAWKDEEVEFFDVVQIFDNEEDAIKAGKEYGQMSIYQIETGKLTWID